MQAITALPFVVKLAVLAAIIWAVGDMTKHALTLYKQGFLKAAPTAIVTLCAVAIGYSLGGLVAAGATALYTLAVLVVAGGVQRGIVIRLRYKSLLTAARAKAAK
ncbi:hypothetical protein SAMN05446935_0340 [Burkholderia sp. YR290]|nr:hypothetical protein SAMN05446935_0340 [Burkholderia sp. YR290]